MARVSPRAWRDGALAGGVAGLLVLLAGWWVARVVFRATGGCEDICHPAPPPPPGGPPTACPMICISHPYTLPAAAWVAVVIVAIGVAALSGRAVARRAG